MKKFLVLYKAMTSGAEQMQGASPEEMQKGMEPWMKWKDEIGDAIVDMGSPLGEAAHVGNDEHQNKGGAHIAGYSVIQAESMDDAKSKLSNHPHLMMEGACIKVLEMMPMPGM